MAGELYTPSGSFGSVGKTPSNNVSQIPIFQSGRVVTLVHPIERAPAWGSQLGVDPDHPSDPSDAMDMRTDDDGIVVSSTMRRRRDKSPSPAKRRHFVVVDS
jgi:hypothetical protein